MSVRVQWEGLEPFKAALRSLPEDLASEAGTIVVAHAQEAERLVANAYPIGPGSKKYPPGNLKRGVRTIVDNQSRFGASATVRSGAPHAHLYENGYTRAGKGTAKKTPQEAIPVFIRVRRRMVMALISLVERAGFQVSAPV